jgi:hypothetical protein
MESEFGALSYRQTRNPLVFSVLQVEMRFERTAFSKDRLRIEIRFFFEEKSPDMNPLGHRILAILQESPDGHSTAFNIFNVLNRDGSLPRMNSRKPVRNCMIVPALLTGQFNVR